MAQLSFEEWKMEHPDLVKQYSEEESTCPDCLGQKVLEIGGEFVECDLCMGEELPACVANCPNEALVYEDDDE